MEFEECWAIVDLETMLSMEESSDHGAIIDVGEKVEQKYLAECHAFLNKMKPTRDHISFMSITSDKSGHEIDSMRFSQQEFKKSLESSLTGLENFLSTIESTSQKQNLLNRREKLLQQFNQLPINNPEVLANLFKPISGPGGQDKQLQDLLAYHELTAMIERVRTIEDKLLVQDPGKRSASDFTMLRRSIEQNLKQVSFKAIQFTIGLVNRDISVLLQLPELNLITVLRPLGLIAEIRPSLLSQYDAHQRLRIRDALADLQINTRKDQIDVLIDMSLEVLLRFCKFDLAVFKGIFTEKPGKEVTELLNNLYVEQATEIFSYLKKSFSMVSAVDFEQVVSLLQNTVKLWNMLTSIQEDFSQLTGGSPGSGKQAPFIQKTSEIIKLAEDFLDKQLQTFEQRIDKYDKSSLTPAVMDEISRNLSQLHGFYASACGVSQSMIFMSVDSLLYPLRPFTNLARKLKSEKSSSQALTFSLRLYCKLLAIARGTIIGRSAKNFIDKMSQYLNENVDTLMASGISKISDMMSKQKVDLRKDIFKLALDPTPSNPIYYVYSSVKLIKDQSLKGSFLENLFQQIIQLGKKMMAGQEEFVSTVITEARQNLSEYLGVTSTEN